MSESKTFTSGTLINSGWLNAVDATTYEALGDGSLNPPTTGAQIVANLSLATQTTVQTLTNKTLTSPVLVTPTVSTGIFTSPTLVTPILGTPTSGIVTNLTGTASININGTVGATTPAAGAFTTVSATGTSTVAAVNASATCSIIDGGGNQSKLRIGNVIPVTLDIGVYNPNFTTAAGVLTTATNHPIEFGVNNIKIAALSSTGFLVSGTLTSTGSLGYATGAGGAVTQITSRTTGVTLNKTAGAITLVSAAGSATAATFTVTNSTVAATDVIILNQKSGTDLYDLMVTAVAAGSFNLTSRTTGGTTTETPVFNFAVIKAVIA